MTPTGAPSPVDPDLGPGDRLGRPIELRVLAVIGAGGFLGALARYEVSLAWPTPGSAFPVTTFTINVSGGFLLGLGLTLLLRHGKAGRYLRPFACVGILGAWTTMSTLALETDLLVRGGHVVSATSYVLATLVAGLAATALGMALAGRRAAGRWAVER